MKDKRLINSNAISKGVRKESTIDRLSRKLNPLLLPLGTVVMGLSALPQVITLYKTKNSSGINPLFIGAVIFSLLTFINNGHVVYLNTGDKSTRRSQYPNLIGMLMVFVMLFIYR